MKPEPVVTSQACSLCGLDWNRHGDKPTAQTCIDLLKADLFAAQMSRTMIVSVPPAAPLRPWAPPFPPWGTITCGDPMPSPCPQTICQSTG